ncbi:MAG: phage portal protein [Roseibium sp.]|nr:phage portal protein [Roseibium sp.]
MTNFIDKAIAFVAPQWGIKRAASRVRLEAFERAYGGANKGRRTDGWRTAGTSADTELALSGALLRERSRDLERNNKHVAKAATVHADNLVGEGITPRANTGDADLNKKIDELFDEWSENCDPGGQLSYHGMQHLAAREMVVAGEMLGRQRIRRMSDGLKVPLQIQMLEPDHIDDARQSPSASRTVVNGIEFDGIGRRTGYWMFPRHPGNRSQWRVGDHESRRIPADQIVHLYEAQRTQCRGAPWTAPIILDVKDLQDYDTAELWRKKLEACLVGVIIPGEDDGLGDPTQSDPSHLGVAVKDVKGKDVSKMEPGVFAVAHGGKDVKFNSPAVTLSQESFNRLSTRGIAAGIRCPHVLMTGDTSQMNYSTFRADMLAYKKFIRSIQKHFILKNWCRPTYGWFLSIAQFMGEIPPGPVPVIWTFPRFEHVNPFDDMRADLIAVRSGFKSLAQVIAEHGGIPEQVLGQIKESNAKLDEMELVLDSDPRNVTLQGQLQFTDQGEANADSA